jgi:hypothetical protein
MLPNSNSALRQTLCFVKLTPASFLKSEKAPSPRSATSPGDGACQGPEQDHGGSNQLKHRAGAKSRPERTGPIMAVQAIDDRTRHQPPNPAAVVAPTTAG